MRLLRIKKSRNKPKKEKMEGIGVEGNGGGGGEAEEDLALFLLSHYTTRITARNKSKETQSKRW